MIAQGAMEFGRHIGSRFLSERNLMCKTSDKTISLGSKPRRLWRSTGVLVGFGLLLTSPLWAANENSYPGDQQPASKTGSDYRIREGSKLKNQLGYFKMTGDRAMFVTADEKQRFGGLENLNLARIVAMISDAPSRMQWSVTGVVTEYQGSNYLLISHAVLKTRANPDDTVGGGIATPDEQPRP